MVVCRGIFVLLKRIHTNFVVRVIEKCHPGYPVDGLHPKDFNLSSTEVSDNLDHFYVHNVRITASRNIKGFHLSPTISRQDRRLLERILNHCLG